MKVLDKKKEKNFWKGLGKPFFVLAPMANVTDYAFRQMIAKYGKPDVMWTEFVSADGLMSKGRKQLLHNLEFSKKEKPIVAQLFTGHPEVMKGTAELVSKLGFDGLDLNMGCPDRAVLKQGGGSSLIKNSKIALEVLKMAREGSSIPISVKTRIGYTKIDLDWIRLLLEQKLPALTVHLRTTKELSLVKAHWDVMPEIIKMRNEISPETLIIGNGDVNSLEMAQEMVRKYGCDGVMIGRGIFGRPWFFSKDPKFSEITDFSSEKTPTKQVRLKIMVEHTKLFEKTFKKGSVKMKNFDVMKKHFKAYVSGWDGAKELRVELMNCKNSKEVEKVVKEYLKLEK
ncbi:MAG: tRNA-dihydrouridine synthase [Candidatus Paceibacterota bacterium]